MATTLTWLGHAAFRMDTPGGKRIYVDPAISGRKEILASSSGRAIPRIMRSERAIEKLYETRGFPFAEVRGVMGGGEAPRLHLVQDDVGPFSGSLPGRLAAGQTSADNENVCHRYSFDRFVAAFFTAFFFVVFFFAMVLGSGRGSGWPARRSSSARRARKRSPED